MTLAVLCPGQGGQRAGMFDLIAAAPDGRALIDKVGVLAGFDLLDPSLHLFDNAVAQPLICAVQRMTWSLLGPRLAALGIEPCLFAGYSVGELAAHGCAGALSLEDTIALAHARATSMDAASKPDDGLIAVRGLGWRAVEALCAEHDAHVAIVNGEDQVLVGGSGAALEATIAAVTTRDGTAQRVPVTVAAHTPLLIDAVEPFRAHLTAARWHSSVPVLAGIDGSLVRDAKTAIDVLARQVATTIRWSDCMDSLRERGTTVCLELGPGHALSRMMLERHREIATRSVADFRSLDGVVDWVMRASI